MPDWGRAAGRASLAFGEGFQRIAPLIKAEREEEKERVKKTWDESDAYIKQLSMKIPKYSGIDAPLKEMRAELDKARAAGKPFNAFQYGEKGDKSIIDVLSLMEQADKNEEQGKFVSAAEEDLAGLSDDIGKIEDTPAGIIARASLDELRKSLPNMTKTEYFKNKSNILRDIGKGVEYQKSHEDYITATWNDAEEQINTLQQLERFDVPGAFDLRGKLELALNSARQFKKPFVIPKEDADKIKEFISTSMATKQVPKDAIAEAREVASYNQRVSRAIALTAGLDMSDPNNEAMASEFIQRVIDGENPTDIMVTDASGEEKPAIVAIQVAKNQNAPKVFVADPNDPTSVEYDGYTAGEFAGEIKSIQKELDKLQALELAIKGKSKIQDDVTKKPVLAKKSSQAKRYGGEDGISKIIASKQESLKNALKHRESLVSTRRRVQPNSGPTLNINDKFIRDVKNGVGVSKQLFDMLNSEDSEIRRKGVKTATDIGLDVGYILENY